MLPGATPVPPRLTLQDLSSVVSFSLEYDLLGTLSPGGRGGGRAAAQAAGRKGARNRKGVGMGGGRVGRLAGQSNVGGKQKARRVHSASCENGTAPPAVDSLFGFSVV